MAELRWVLLALGVMLVAGIYLWGRGVFRRSGEEDLPRRRRRSEPRFSSEDEPVSDDVLFAPPGAEGDGAVGASSLEEAAVDDVPSDEELAEPAEAPPPPVDKVVALRFVPRTMELDAAEAVRTLRDAGLEHGRYGIFHYYHDDFPGEAQFSVASLTEPGSFDLDRLDEPLAGMSFFMILPGAGDPVERFDVMVETARALAHQLDAELFDDRGGDWTIQRERYIREELISYRLQSAPS
jgi:cell division protein ZipA